MDTSDDKRLVKVFWKDVAPECGLQSGPFLLWKIRDQLYHNDDGKVGYFCGYVENANIYTYVPECPSCGSTSGMILYGDEWVCHKTHTTDH